MEAHCWAEIDINCERYNPHDKFAVCGKITLPRKLVRSVVGHVPREIARHMLALLKGMIIIAKVQDPRPRKLPLVRGGLVILICGTAQKSSKF